MKRTILIIGIALGILLASAPLWGLAGTVLGMTRAFTVLKGPGISDPKELSDAIGVTLLWTASGLFLCPFGLALGITSTILLVLDKPKRMPPRLPGVRESSR
jgi:MotA/TolQ/ExbB proton channel family